MSSKKSTFPVGSTGRRELRRALAESTYPEETINEYQKAHSLHKMVARALGTASQVDSREEIAEKVEPLETDPVLIFLSHLGVSQHEVHKRVAEALRTQLEDEIRKVRGSEAPLISLLKSCWTYATSLPELRPVLLSVLKQLGSRTPLPVLERLAERDEKSGKLTHFEVWNALPPLLKRLVWEADWDRCIPMESETPPEQFLAEVDSTLLGEVVQPLVDEYCTTGDLPIIADHVFVGTTRERRFATSQRRTVSGTNSTESTPLAPIGLRFSMSTSTSNKSRNLNLADSARSVAKLRDVLGGPTERSGGSSSYRPKLLNALLSILMARHGKVSESHVLLGASCLHCTLVTDILLSAGGSLPKEFQQVVRLARVLDDNVKAGDLLKDSTIAVVQSCLRVIFQTGDPHESDRTMAGPRPRTQLATKEEDLEFTKVLLKRIIEAGLSAMKKTDPRSLFINPVTDAIAPNYSDVIEQPICIKAMEEKVNAGEYSSLEEWDRDVNLMFRNCIAYNTGSAGQWFRGEARRQGKVYKEEVFAQARKLFQTEMSKRQRTTGATVPSLKRKALLMEAEAPEDAVSVAGIEPLLPSPPKKRKSGSENTALRIQALASMILADPFVVRLVLDRILRLLRINVIRGTSVPAAHKIIPSLLQVLHIVQLSPQTCASRGGGFFVPDVGLGLGVGRRENSETSAAGSVPFCSLRAFLPTLTRLLVESELDRRTAPHGDLYTSAKSLPLRPSFQDSESLPDGSKLHSVRALVEGALVHVCQPGNSSESSLASSFPKFALVLSRLSVNLFEEKPFFLSLVEALLHHKSKLSRSTRDEVLRTWFQWFKAPSNDNAHGAMTSSLHECLILLLNEWAALGNQLLPRDVFLHKCQAAVNAANATESSGNRKFHLMWSNSESESQFSGVKRQYERMLQSIPVENAKEWKALVLIDDLSSEEKDAKVSSAK